MASSLLPLRRMKGFGIRRKRRVRRTRLMAGGRKMRLMGSGRRRVGSRLHRKRRTIRGGFFGNILKGLHSVARSVPIVSTALGATGNPVASGIARSLGYGRRRRVRKGTSRARTHKYGGRKMSVYGGARRRKRMFSVYGGRRRTHKGTYRARAKRRVTHRGRGFMDLLRKGHDLVKSHGLISKGLSHFGQDKYSGVAKALGYGRRVGSRLHRKKRTHRGGFMRGFMGAIPLAMNRGLGRRRHVRRARTRTMRGGFIGSLLSNLLGGARSRRIKRTYPSGLLTRRR